MERMTRRERGEEGEWNSFDPARQREREKERKETIPRETERKIEGKRAEKRGAHLVHGVQRLQRLAVFPGPVMVHGLLIEEPHALHLGEVGDRLLILLQKEREREC